MIRRPPRSTQSRSSAASDVYKRQVLTVFITILIGVLKIFDIVWVTTQGLFRTNVIANDFFVTLFQFGDSGRSSAIVVVLLILVLPVMIYQVRNFRAQEANS